MDIGVVLLTMVIVSYTTMIAWTYVGLWMTHIYHGWIRILMSIFWPVALIDNVIQICIEYIQTLRGRK